MAAVLGISSVPFTVYADSSKVVTLGADLTDEQKESMYEYFGTTADEVTTIEVTNADEREYMEGIASEEQIGTRTYSCSYVEPTSSGGIQVKTANLTYVTSSMISSTLLTSGVENCNVVAASPIEVSGTGALTGIMMAYESASGETLDEGQKEAAIEELVTTGELADEYGDDTASSLMNDVKEQIIEDDITDASEIQDVVSDTADSYNITLTDEQIDTITSLMEKISQYDYDIDALKDTLDNLNGKSGGFFSDLWDSIVSFFTGDDSDGGILNDTQDDVLGDDVVTDSTLETSESDSTEDSGGFWNSIVNFFKDLFSIDDDSVSEEDTTDSSDDLSSDNDNIDTADEETDSDNGEAENDIETDGTADEDGTDSTDGADGADSTDSVDGADETDTADNTDCTETGTALER